LIFLNFIGSNFKYNSLNNNNSYSEENSQINLDILKSSSDIGILWERTWGYSTREWSPSIAIDNESNLLVAGNLDHYDDIFIAKYNTDGDQLWNKTWDKNSHDQPYDIVLDKNNNIYIAGRTGTWGSSDKVMLLIKLNSTGDEIWHREWSGSNDMGARAIALDNSENIYVVGRPDNDDIFLRKYNSTGDLNWSKTWGGTGGGYENWYGVYGIIINYDDNIYITGRSDTLGAGGQDMILLNYNTTGDLQWSKTWGYSGDERGYDIKTDSDKDLYVTCFSSTTNTLYIIKYNSSGSQLWNKSLGIFDIGSGFQMDIDDQDNIYLTGTRQDNNKDIFFMILNTSGSILRDINWSTSSLDGGTSIKLNELGEIYVAGTTTSIGAGQEDIIILKYNNSIYKFNPEIIFEISNEYLNTTTPLESDLGLEINCSVLNSSSLKWVYLWKLKKKKMYDYTEVSDEENGIWLYRVDKIWIDSGKVFFRTTESDPGDNYGFLESEGKEEDKNIFLVKKSLNKLA